MFPALSYVYIPAEDPDYTFPSPLLRFIRPHARLDVMSAPTETTKLFSPSHQSLTKRDQLKFPLGLVPQRVRPYLELIRFEKVGLARRL